MAVALGSGVLAVLVVAGTAGLLIPRLLPRDAGVAAGTDRFEVVATVDGEPIVYGELRSRTPAALEQSVRAKLQQIEARRQGLTGDIGYRAALAELERVNRARSAKVRNGGVVYGPVTYDETRFLDERLRQLRDGLRARLTVSDAEVARYYADNKQRFSLGDSRKVIGISAGTQDGVSRLAELERRLAAGESFDTVYAELRHAGAGGLTVEERSFDYRTFRKDSITSPVLLRAVDELDAGQVTGVVADARSAGIYKCVARRSLGYAPLEQVRPGIVDDLRARKYDALVGRWRADAEVEVTPAGATLGLSADGAAG
ncbi:hypothetical protein GCM10027569_55870 [Flindersiella endophytica]